MHIYITITFNDSSLFKIFFARALVHHQLSQGSITISSCFLHDQTRTDNRFKDYPFNCLLVKNNATSNHLFCDVSTTNSLQIVIITLLGIVAHFVGLNAAFGSLKHILACHVIVRTVLLSHFPVFISWCPQK